MLLACHTDPNMLWNASLNNGNAPTLLCPLQLVFLIVGLPWYGHTWCSDVLSNVMLLPIAAGSCCFVSSGKEGEWEVSNQEQQLVVN